MPLSKFNGEPIFLAHEMPGGDFCIGLFDYLHPNFSCAPYYRGEQHDQMKQELADFLGKMRGPYFVAEFQETLRHHLAVVLFHPQDYADFAAAYQQWKEDPKAFDKNIEMLAKHSKAGFAFQNPDLAELSAFVGMAHSPQEVGDLMRYLWTPASRSARIPATRIQPAVARFD